MPRKSKQLRFGRGFSVALTNARAQAATMVIAPGDSEGGPDNDHRGADQWLFVLSGTGSGKLNGKTTRTARRHAPADRAASEHRDSQHRPRSAANSQHLRPARL